MENEKVIFSYRIARKLIQDNFTVKDIRPNKKVEGTTVFVFEDTERLRNKMKEVQNYYSS